MDYYTTWAAFGIAACVLAVLIVLGTRWVRARERKQEYVLASTQDVARSVDASAQDRALASPMIPTAMRETFTLDEREDLVQIAMTLAGYGYAMKLTQLRHRLTVYPSLQDWYWNYVAGFKLSMHIKEGTRDFDSHCLDEISYLSIDDLLNENAVLLFLVLYAPHLRTFYHEEYEVLPEHDKANGLKFDTNINVVLDRLCALRDEVVKSADM